jgi:hypothetical protein
VLPAAWLDTLGDGDPAAFARCRALQAAHRTLVARVCDRLGTAR